MNPMSSAKRTAAMAIADERRDPLDLRPDGRGLGLGQVDVGHGQPHTRLAGRPDLREQARWLGNVRGATGRPGWCSGSGGRASGADGVGRMIAATGDGQTRGRPPPPRRTVTLTACRPVPDRPAPDPDGRAAEHRVGADGRRDARHERRRDRPLPDRGRGHGRPDHGPARPSRGRHARPSPPASRAATSWSAPAASDRRPTTSPARPSPRSAARPRSWTRTWRPGCASCGRVATCRSRTSTSSRPG